MAVDADVVKVAWTARSLRDCLEAFELPGLLGVPTVALCMGPFGLPSRVLRAKFGGFLTFAALDADSATAPGQPTLSQLMDLYRFRSIDTNDRGVWRGRLAGGTFQVSSLPQPSLRRTATQRGVFAFAHSRRMPRRLWPPWTLGWPTLGLDLRGLSVTLPHKETLASFVAERGGICDEATRLSKRGQHVAGGCLGTVACVQY